MTDIRTELCVVDSALEAQLLRVYDDARLEKALFTTAEELATFQIYSSSPMIWRIHGQR
jgi:hypothetical protein